MEEDKQEPKRRVSFAVNSQISYIPYQEDSSTVARSSASLESTMDITTELAELKNLNLFTRDGEGAAECAGSEVLERRTSLMRRKSLDPLKFIEFGDAAGEQENTENQTHVEEAVAKKTASNNTVGLFWRASVKSNPGKSENMDEVGAINSSFDDAEEFVNTIDLRKIIPQEYKEKVSVGDFLQSQNIRFLDEAVIHGMKRDTLSKSRNAVDPAMVYYYKYSLSERIEFLYSFSNFLINKMEELQDEIREAENKIDVAAVNKDSLKKIRNEARNRSKIDWYSLRKIHEIQFNKKIIENKSIVTELLNKAGRENMKLDKAIAVKNEEIEGLQSGIAGLREIASRFENENIQRAERLREMITERRKVLEAASAELEDTTRVLNAQRSQEEAIQGRIEKLKCEISNLKKNLAIKNVNEHQLEEIRKRVERYSTVYQIKLVKMTKQFIAFEIFGNTISADLNGLLDVVAFSVVKSQCDPYSEFAKSLVQNFTHHKIDTFIRSCLEVYCFCASLKREISIMKESFKVECFYLNACLYLRIHLAESKEYFDLSINGECCLVYNGSVCSDLKESLGALSEFVSKIIK